MTNKTQLLIRCTDPNERKRLTEEYAYFEFEVVSKDDEYIIVRKAQSKKKRPDKNNRGRDSRTDRSETDSDSVSERRGTGNRKGVRNNNRNSQRHSDSN